MSPSPAVPTANLAPSGGTLKELVVFMLLMCVLGQNMAFSAVEEIHYSLPEVPIAWGGGVPGWRYPPVSSLFHPSFHPQPQHEAGADASPCKAPFS